MAEHIDLVFSQVDASRTGRSQIKMRTQLNFGARFFSKAVMPAITPCDRFSLKISGPFSQATVSLALKEGQQSGYTFYSIFHPRPVPGPSMLDGALQCLQDSQSGIFLGAIADFQIPQDNSLQPLQVTRYQDAKSADTKKHTLRREMYTKAKASPRRAAVAALTSARRQAGSWHTPAEAQGDALPPCGSEPAAAPHRRGWLVWSASAAAGLSPGSATSPAGTAVLPGLVRDRKSVQCL